VLNNDSFGVIINQDLIKEEKMVMYDFGFTLYTFLIKFWIVAFTFGMVSVFLMMFRRKRVAEGLIDLEGGMKNFGDFICVLIGLGAAIIACCFIC
jgi:hypothetical protein